MNATAGFPLGLERDAMQFLMAALTLGGSILIGLAFTGAALNLTLRALRTGSAQAD